MCVFMCTFSEAGRYIFFVVLKSEGEIEDAEAIDQPIPVQVGLSFLCMFSCVYSQRLGEMCVLWC